MNTTVRRAGLTFTTTNIVELNPDGTVYHDFDIIAIVIFTPNCIETPLIIVDWYFGPPQEEFMLPLIDKFLTSQTGEDILRLIELQDANIE